MAKKDSDIVRRIGQRAYDERLYELYWASIPVAFVGVTHEESEALSERIWEDRYSGDAFCASFSIREILEERGQQSFLDSFQRRVIEAFEGDYKPSDAFIASIDLALKQMRQRHCQSTITLNVYDCEYILRLVPFDRMVLLSRFLLGLIGKVDRVTLCLFSRIPIRWLEFDLPVGMTPLSSRFMGSTSMIRNCDVRYIRKLVDGISIEVADAVQSFVMGRGAYT